MKASKLAACVMAGGLGTRMRSAMPKHLHPLLGRRMIDWVLDAARALEPQPLVVVASPESQEALADLEPVIQTEPRGTGDALAVARPALEGHDGDLLVMAGDTPLLRSELLEKLVSTHRKEGAAATVLSFRRGEPGSYGRVLRDESGAVRGIVEAADASPEELAVRELNSSIYVFAASKVWPLLERLRPANAQGELYLTDAVRLLVEDGEHVAAHEANDPIEAEGVNTKVELAAAAAVLRERVNSEHMLAGVTIVDPTSTWIDADVELEPDAVIEPFTVLRGRTSVGAGARVGPHVVAVDAAIGPRVSVGPFCYLRPGTVLEPDAKAGTFVEIKNSRIGAGAKVPHSSYIGDAEVGEGTNIAAGNITVNYPHEPGRPKSRTTIGRNVRTGVHNAFVAPIEIGDDAWIAAGSVLTKDVPPGALAIARARQVNKEGYATRGKRDDDE